MRFRWPWRSPAKGDAVAELAKLCDRDGEVERLGRELRETRSRNNFSAMVNYALSRHVNGRP